MPGERTPRLEALVSEIFAHAEEYVQLSRRSVGVAWRLGDKLLEVKSSMSRDEWFDLVNTRMPIGARGVTATRFVSLREEYQESSEAEAFESVTQALMSKGRTLRKYP